MPETELSGAAGDLVPVTCDGDLRGNSPLLWDNQIATAAVRSLQSRYEFRFRYADIAQVLTGC